MDDADDEPIKKRSKSNEDGDGLEDSDDDDEDDDDDDASASSDKKRKKLRKMRDVDELDDDDLALINEAKGITNTSAGSGGGNNNNINKGNNGGNGNSYSGRDNNDGTHHHPDGDYDVDETHNRRISTVKAKSAQELSRGLFTGDTDSEDDDEDGGGRDDGANKKQKKNQKTKQQQQQLSSSQPERYDEDGLDDFIEDDTGYGLEDDDDDYGRSGGGVRGDKGAISEAQLNEAEDIFGTGFLDFMDGGAGGEEDDDEGLDEDYDPENGGGRRKRRKSKFKEAGVGVALGVDSDEEIEEGSSDEEDSDDDDADLFGDDDMEDDMGYKQRAEVLKLKREKKRLAREERRRQKRERVDAKRKAQLRRAFEPVQLVENFCTERDDAIRMVDSPERYYDWLEANTASSSRKVLALSDEIDMEEEEEAMWIKGKIPAFSSEIATAVSNATAAAAASGAGGESVMVPDTDDVMEKADRTIIESIAYALRYMRGERLEPEFIKRYRMDIVTSPAVRDNLYRIMDEDSEWERMTEARTKIEGALQSFREEEEEPANNKGGGPEVERAARLKEQFKVAEENLNNTVEQERKVQEQLDELEKPKEKGGDDDDDDDDDLFGDDDEDDEAVSFNVVFRVISLVFAVYLISYLSCPFIRQKQRKKRKKKLSRITSTRSTPSSVHKQKKLLASTLHIMRLKGLPIL